MMNQKTIKYTADYDHFPKYKEIASAVHLGDEVMLVEKNYEDGRPSVFDIRIGCPDGIGGNMNPAIKRYHGWRGTSYGVSVNALGLRKVIKIQHGKDVDGDNWIKITVGKDLRPDED